MGESLFLEERRRAILERLEQTGRVTVKTLSAWMGVSEVTIRQDLRALEAQGLIERTYGGAVYRGGAASLPELSFKTRLMKKRRQKDALAAHAAALIHDGYTVALDSSSTVYALAPHLKQHSKLTIVTNGLMLVQSFLDENDQQARVLLLGGRLRRDAISVVGALESVPDVNMNIGFFSSRGVEPSVGATEVDPDEGSVKQALLRRCLYGVFLVDGEKWGKIAPYTILPTAEIQHIITTDDAPPDAVEGFRAQGVRVDVVSVAH